MLGLSESQDRFEIAALVVHVVALGVATDGLDDRERSSSSSRAATILSAATSPRLFIADQLRKDSRLGPTIRKPSAVH